MCTITNPDMMAPVTAITIFLPIVESQKPGARLSGGAAASVLIGSFQSQDGSSLLRCERGRGALQRNARSLGCAKAKIDSTFYYWCARERPSRLTRKWA